MDYTLNGRLNHCVLLLMLLEIQWRPVFLAPTQTHCEDALNQTHNLARVIRREANQLLDAYVKFHGAHPGSVPDNVPDLTISGVNITEKLQEIYFKTVHLYLHLSQVEEQQKKNWGNPQSVVEPLTRVKGRLQHLSAKLKHTLLYFDSEISLSTPAPPQLSHTDDYAKKEYGWGVIDKLKDWPHQVLQVLKAEEVCDKFKQ